MKQTSMSDFENSLHKRTTKREEFLRAMDAFIPWAVWISLIEPYYPAGKRERKPRGIEIMLRMYLCNAGSIFLMKLLKRPYMIATPSACSRASTFR